MVLRLIFTILAIVMIPVTIHFWNHPVKWVSRLLGSEKLNPDLYMLINVVLCVIFAIIAIILASPFIGDLFMN